jgi:hypothetical protein
LVSSLLYLRSFNAKQIIQSAVVMSQSHDNITIYDIINWFCSPQRYNYTHIHAYIPAHIVCIRRGVLDSDLTDIISGMLIKPTLAEFELSSIRGTKSISRLNSLLSCSRDEALLTSVFKCFECLGLLFNKLILTVRYISFRQALFYFIFP